MEENEAIIQVRGDAFNVTFEVDGLDFTNLDVRSHFKKDINSATPDIEFKEIDGSIVPTQISTTVWQLLFTKTSAQMQNVAVGTYKYDIEVEDSAGNITTICNGVLKIIKDVTV